MVRMSGTFWRATRRVELAALSILNSLSIENSGLSGVERPSLWEEGQVNIRSIVEAHDAQFISLVDLCQATEEATGFSFDEVVRAFWLTRLLDKARHWKKCVRTGDLSESDGEVNRCELAQLMGARQSEELTEERVREMSDFRHGFLRSEIRATMIECGLDTPPCLEDGGRPFVYIDPDLKPLYDHVALLQDRLAEQNAEIDRLRTELKTAMDSTSEAGSGISVVRDDRAVATDLAAEVRQLRDKLEVARKQPGPAAWTAHNTRVFKLLATVIDNATALPAWPKQEVLIPDLMKQYGLTEAEAKAIDTVTRPDKLRRK